MRSSKFTVGPDIEAQESRGVIEKGGTDTDMGTDRDGATFWHGELPPLDAEPIGEHTMEAMSMRVPGTLAHRDDLWSRCYADLMNQARIRLAQELIRLGGDYAHVLNEHVNSRHDAATAEVWLYGQFVYMLYRRIRSHNSRSGAD
jgi:hypothetical protein